MATANSDFNEFMKRYREEQEAKRLKATESFAHKAVPGLAKLGVRKIDVEYSGSGDSGGVDSVTCYDEDGNAIAEPLDERVRELIHAYAYEILPGGFEINEGGQGVLKIDVVKGTYKLHHQQNVVEIVESEEEGKF